MPTPSVSITHKGVIHWHNLPTGKHLSTVQNPNYIPWFYRLVDQPGVNWSLLTCITKYQPSVDTRDIVWSAQDDDLHRIDKWQLFGKKKRHRAVLHEDICGIMIVLWSLLQKAQRQFNWPSPKLTLRSVLTSPLRIGLFVTVPHGVFFMGVILATYIYLGANLLQVDAPKVSSNQRLKSSFPWMDPMGHVRYIYIHEGTSKINLGLPNPSRYQSSLYILTYRSSFGRY